jgi:hypothetical protein
MAIKFLINLRNRIFLRFDVCRYMHARQRSPKVGFDALRPVVSLDRMAPLNFHGNMRNFLMPGELLANATGR